MDENSVAAAEIFLIGELSLTIQDISPRSIPNVIASVKSAVTNYLKEHNLSLPLKVRGDLEREIIFALIARSGLSPRALSAVEDAVLGII